jgi:predicted RNase H-like nuclease (RuvC/YqgF family)
MKNVPRALIAGARHSTPVLPSKWHKGSYPALRYMEMCENRASAFERQVTERKRQVEDRDRQISELKQALAQLRHTHQRDMAALQRELSHFRSQLHIIIASRSWKVARFLHTIAAPLKRYLVRS